MFGICVNSGDAASRAGNWLLLKGRPDGTRNQLPGMCTRRQPMGSIMGILRYTIILGAAALAMPNPPPSAEQGGAVPQTASSFAYVAAAAETFADLRAFCVRRPGVCQTAGHVAGTMEAKAKYSAKLIYEWANEASSAETHGTSLPPDMTETDPIATGTTGASKGAAVSQSTLRLEDLIPEWRAPANMGMLPKKG